VNDSRILAPRDLVITTELRNSLPQPFNDDSLKLHPICSSCHNIQCDVRHIEEHA